MTASSISITLDAKTGQFRAEMTGAATLGEREARRLEGAIKLVNDRLKETAKLTKVAGESSAGIQQSSKAMEEFGFHTAGAKRELLVLGHELSQGNYKRFAGSLLVLGERTGAAALLFSGMGIAALGATAVLGGFAAAALKGAQESENLRKSLVLTGNYAGITEGQFNALAKSVAATTRSTVGSARDALQAVVSSGRFGPGQIDGVAQAVSRLERLTGEDAEKIVGDFARMGDGVAKWAAEHNRSMHFLSAAQYEYIKTLEEQGQTEKAQQATIDALNEHVKAHARQLGYVAQAWEWSRKKASDYFDSVAGLGRGSSIDDLLKRAQDRANALKAAASTKAGFIRDQYAPEIADADSLVASLKNSKKLADDVSAAVARSQKVQSDAIGASDIVKRITEENDKRSKATKLVEEYTAAVRKMREANDPKAPSLAQESATVKLIRERNRNPDDKAADSEAKKLANSIKERLQLYAQESARLKEQEDEYAKYGKVVDKSAEAIARVDISTGKYAKALPALKTAILDAARAEDVQAAKTKSAEEFAKKAAEDAKKREEAALALRKHLEDSAIATQIEIDKLDEETKFLGLNTAARRIAIEQLKIEKDARRLLADPKNAGHAEEIDVAANRQKTAIEDAIKRNDETQKSFSYGAAKAFKQYQLDAQDAAKFAEQYIGGSLSRLEDALVNFVKTGKLSFSDLFSFMAEEYIRQQIRMAVSSVVGLGGSGGAGGGSGGFLSSLVSIGSSFFGAPHAQGLDYVPYDGYLARLHEGEKVQTKQAAAAGRSGSGGGNVVDASIGTLNVGQGVSRAEMAAALAQHRKYIDGRVQRLQLNGRIA